MGLMEVGRLTTDIIPFCRSHGGLCVQYAMGTISLTPRIWYNQHTVNPAYLLTPCPLPYMFRQGPKTRSGAATADVALTREQES